MGKNTELDNEDEVILEEETEEASFKAETEEASQTQTTQAESENDELDGGEVVITIDGDNDDDDGEPAAAPPWISELRRKNREQNKRIKELESRLEQTSTTKLPTLGPKPSLESCDYDEDKFDQELAGWYERKRQFDDEEKRIENEQRTAQEAWNQKIQGYESAKNALKIKGFEEAEDLVKTLFSTTQQGAIIQGAKDPAALIYVIGKNPTRAQELAKIQDPVEFIFAIAELQAKMKITPKKRVPATQPEKRVTGSQQSTSAVDSTLERLRAEAEKTGDYSRVTAYKRQKRQG